MAFRTAYLVTGSAADADDAAQEAFVKAWRSLGRFRPGAPLKPWLLQIVVNESRNRRRSAGRRAGLELRVATEPRPPVRRRSTRRSPPTSAPRAARGARSPERGRPARDLVPLPARPLRGGDRHGTRAAKRHREVTPLAGARAHAGDHGGGGGMNDLETGSAISSRVAGHAQHRRRGGPAPGASAGAPTRDRRPLAVALAGLLLLSGGALAASRTCATPSATCSASAAWRSSACRSTAAARANRRGPGPGPRAVACRSPRQRALRRPRPPALRRRLPLGRARRRARVLRRQSPTSLLTEFRGDQVRTFIQKSIGPGRRHATSA